MATLTAALIKSALSQVGDVAAALNAGLTDIADDETVAVDILTDVAQLDPALAPQVAIASALVPIVAWVIQNNQSAKPGAQLPPFAGGDNSNPARGR